MFKRRKPNEEDDGDNPLASRVVRGDDSPTEPVDAEDGSPTRRLETSADAPTRLLNDSPAGGTDDPMADPPVGVLLVVTGPGRGRLLHLGLGVNELGRSTDARVALDFGDGRISRRDHARVTYDPEGRRFYLQHGGGPNLTYLDEAPVLEPVVLPDGARLRVGDTVLLFRALAGENFDWSDTRSPGPDEP